MEALPQHQTATLWKTLAWQSARLEPTNSRQEPLCVPGAHRGPGIYRMTWCEESTWADAQKQRLVNATAAIADPRLDLDSLSVPVILTIGRSTNVYVRIRQHFGANRNNNRIFTRIQELFPVLAPEETREIAQASIGIEWAPVASWAERSLLERFGCATERPVFDIDAER